MNWPRVKRVTCCGKDDVLMMGVGAFSPLIGFMKKADWKSVCEKMMLTDGTFLPIPVTLSVSKEDAKTIQERRRDRSLRFQA